MRILWLNWRDSKNPEAGGAERWHHEVAKYLIDKGHSVTIFCPMFRDSPRNEVHDRIRIIRRGNKFTVYGKAKKYFLENKSDYDFIIDVHNGRPFHTPKFVKNLPILFLVHQLEIEKWYYETRFPLNSILFRMEKRWLKQYLKIHTAAVSKSTQQDLINLGIKNVRIITEGLDFIPSKNIPKKSNNSLIIFIGRLKKIKRPTHALESFRIIKKNIPNAEMIVIGDGYLRKNLSKKYPEVKFLQNISQEEKLKIIRSAHLLLATGIREGWGLVITEAASMGTPSVAYDVPGLRDSVLDGKTGLLVEAGNIEEMSDKACRILLNKDLWEKIARGALKWSSCFSWEKTGKEFENYMYEIVDSFKKKSHK